MSNLLKWSLLLLISACSISPKPKENLALRYPPELEEVHSLIIQKKTADARLRVDDYLNKAENIHWYGHAYFLKAFLYEMDENYNKAIEHYRSAVQHGSQYESRVEAKALYNLSFVYEKIDHRNELLTTLIDLMKRREYFDILTGQVEIPARLAAAYASLGKLKEALIFHREAARNFKDLVRNEKFKAEKTEISKSLYYLGFATFDENDEKFENLVKKLNTGQKFFLASAEASKSTWSEKSVERLRSQYDKAWGMVLQYQPKGIDFDPQAKKKQMQRKQLKMASELYDLMFLLKAEEFPMGEVNPRSKAIIDITSQWIDKIEAFAMTLKIGPEMVRDKAVKNTKLARYVDDEIKKVQINKEQSKEESKSAIGEESSENSLPAKTDIGKDPNL